MQDPNCAGCQKVNRHPGDGYTCMTHRYHDPLCRTFACSLEVSDRTKVEHARERLVVIAGAAQEAFWKAVAKMLPEATTGDMDVGAIMEFSRACDKAVGIWARTNVRKVSDTIDEIIAGEARRGVTSTQIRDEIIANVGMMVSARTPEMQRRYEAALIRESCAIASPPQDFKLEAYSLQAEINRQEHKRERRKADLAEHNRDDGPQCEAKGQCQDLDGSGACTGCGRWLGDGVVGPERPNQ